GPAAGNMPRGQPFIDFSFLADDAADTAEVISGGGKEFGDIVECIGKATGRAGPCHWQGDGKGTFFERSQHEQNLLGVQVGARRRRRGNVWNQASTSSRLGSVGFVPVFLSILWGRLRGGP